VSTAPDRQLRTGLAVPSVFVLVALVALVGLGTWQIQRKTWKETVIDTLQRRLSAPPTVLPPREHWAGLDPSEHEFRRVKFSAVFAPGEEALVYSGGSALRSDVSGPGYWVFAPARSEAGATIVVNRGFVPEGRRDPATRDAAGPSRPVDLIGAMRWPERRGWFAPTDSPGQNLWFLRDHVAIAAVKGWGEVAPFYIELEDPQPSGGLPRASALKVNLRNEHLQYAITWYGLAVALTVMFVFWLRGRRTA
jgi:surfeit locus 1 family protein